MRGATYLTKLDLRTAYHQSRIRPGDEWKAAFRCKYGVFEPLVMFKGWMNAPPHFQRMVDEITAGLKDLKSYIDENGVFSWGTLEQHIEAVQAVLHVYRKHHYYLNAKKCVFHAQEIPFAGYRVGTEGTRIADESLMEINELPRPVSVASAQALLGLLNYFTDWIPRYADVVAPIQAVATPGASFIWGPAQEAAFQHVKEICKQAPALAPADRDHPFIMYTDASPYALGAVLLQEDPKTHQLRPIQFRARKLKPAERNYTINDKELLAIVDSFKHWRHWLSGTIPWVEVRTDHRNLTYFMSNHRLTPRHLRWANDLAEYNFRIRHVPATQNRAADALSRNPDFQPTAEETSLDRTQVLLPTEYFSHLSNLSHRLSNPPPGTAGHYTRLDAPLSLHIQAH